MSKKPKIKFLLAQVGKAVIFEIYEMDERFRSKKREDSIEYVAANSVEVESSVRPYLSLNAVGL